METNKNLRHGVILRRIIALSLAMALMLACPMITTQDAAAKTTKTVTVKKVETTLYAQTLANQEKVKLYFKGKSDIPYIALEEWGEAIQFQNTFFDQGFRIKNEVNGKTFSYVREDGFYRATFDFSKKTLYFNDMDAFFRRNNVSLAGSEAMTPMVSSLFERDLSMWYNIYGSGTTINLKKYSIPMFIKGKKHFIPLQTFSDFIWTRTSGYALVYNGENIYTLVGNTNNPSDMLDSYHSAPKRKMSKTFVNFNYHELCCALDYSYGLKSEHGIKDFDTYLRNNGLAYYFLNYENNATSVDTGIYGLTWTCLADGHSGLLSQNMSYNSDYTGNTEMLKQLQKSCPYGSNLMMIQQYQSQLDKGYAKYYPNGTEYYEEVGDTAYIKFDAFTGSMIPIDNSTAPTKEELGVSNFRLMQYACDQILRENSPIKRVVLDLSMNAGGEINSAVYVNGTFLGTGIMAMKNTLTGSITNAAYKIDTNRDGVFDDKDTLANKGLKLYCIISGSSFSCGNMVPCLFKDTKRVTLIGQTSGGGSCAVGTLSTASGTVFTLSSTRQFSFFKNGSLYNVDRGADPDVYVKDITKLYDRTYCNKFLDTIE